MPDESQAEIVCATYTHARRHPMVLGHIGGWTPPFQVSVTQLVVLIVTFWVEMQTWRWWGAFLPRILGLVLAVAVPCLLAWAVRRTRIEGRSLPRAVLGWLTVLWAPRGGQVAGRPYHHAAAAQPGRAPVFVAPGDDEP